VSQLKYFWIPLVLFSSSVSAQYRIDDFRLFQNHTRNWLYKYSPVEKAVPVAKREPTEAELDAIKYADQVFSGTEARAIVLVDQGKVVYERIKEPADVNSPFHGYSVTKSVVSAGIGKAVCNGTLKMDQKASSLIPALQGTALGNATVRDLLMMASGASSTTPDGNIPGLVRVVDYADEGSIETVLSQSDVSGPRKGLFNAYKPGEVFDYKNQDPETLGLMIHKATGHSMATWLTETVFKPAGLAGPVFMGADTKGYTNSSYGLRMRTEDWARLAIWMKEQTRQADCFGEYLREATKTQIGNAERRTAAFARGYGYLFWTDFPDAPSSYWALGYGGQRIAWHTGNDKIMIVFSTAENWSSEGFRLFNLWSR
jgi:CubicO group peptidase (beta-lactamase class C family)